MKRLGFAWFGLALAFVNKCSGKMTIITIINHKSTPLISFEESHHFVNPGVKVGLVGEKVVSFAEGSRQEVS
jgi:hypothetical protein